MTVAWEPRGCGSQEDLLSHSPKWKEMVPPESLNTLLSLQKKGLEIILMQGCHCKIFGSIVARHPPWHMQPPPGLTAWEEPLGLDFSPYLCPCLGATSTTVHGGHDLRYALNNASVRAVNSYRNPGHVVLGTEPFFFPIPFLCAPLHSLHLGPSGWAPNVSAHDPSVPSYTSDSSLGLVPSLQITDPLPHSSEIG